MQDDGVVRLYYEMLLSQSVNKMKLEHTFETVLEENGGVPPMLAKVMLATESARSTVVEPERAARSASRKARRTGAKSSKRK